ncbi:hypothetical protein D3C81_1987460 [compost metagenome]
MLPNRGEHLPALPLIEPEKRRQPARHRLGQFGVVDRHSSKCLTVFQTRRQQPPHPTRDEIFRAAER